MSKPSLFSSRDEIIDFILTQLKEVAPNAHYQPLPNTRGQEYKIWFTGIKEVTSVNSTMELYDVLRRFEETSDINVLVDFINTQGILLNRISSLAENKPQPELTDKIIPVIQEVKFNPYVSDELKEISDKIGNNLKVMYAYHTSKGLEFIHQGSIPPDMNHDSLADKAFHNLKSHGWLNHVQKIEGPGADLYVFESQGDRPFHAQFLLGEWTKARFGQEFHFAFPTEKTAFVMVPTGKEAKLLLGPSMSPKYALATLANQLYHMHPNSLSPLAYTFNKGRIESIR